MLSYNMYMKSKYVPNQLILTPEGISFKLLSSVEKLSSEMRLKYPQKRGWLIECHCGNLFVNWPNKIERGTVFGCNKHRGEQISKNRDHNKGNEKRKQTNLRTYGVENVAQIGSIRQANSQFQKENSEDIIAKGRETLKIRYGVANPGQTQSSIEKQQQSGKYYVIKETGQTLKAWHEAFAPDISYGHLREMIADKETISVKDLEAAVSFMRDKGSSLEKYFAALTGLEIYGKSSLQNALRKFDFKLNEKLFINVDGLWAHCEKRREDGYHEKIRLQAESEGVRLIQFREDEVKLKSAIVLSMTRHAQGLSAYKYNARQLEIKKVPYLEGANFFQENHIMGYASAQYYGLYTKDNILVSCIGVIKKQETLDIKRFANKLNCSVRGGLSKLLKFVENTYNPKEVLYWVDLRYGQGESLMKSGYFKANNDERSFSWTNGVITKHRLAFNDKSAAENKFYKIWDAGQRKLIKILN